MAIMATSAKDPRDDHNEFMFFMVTNEMIAVIRTTPAMTTNKIAGNAKPNAALQRSNPDTKRSENLESPLNASENSHPTVNT